MLCVVVSTPLVAVCVSVTVDSTGFHHLICAPNVDVNPNCNSSKDRWSSELIVVSAYLPSLPVNQVDSLMSELSGNIVPTQLPSSKSCETKLPVLAGLPDVIVVIVVVSPTFGVSSNITSVALLTENISRLTIAIKNILILSIYILQYFIVYSLHVS